MGSKGLRFCILLLLLVAGAGRATTTSYYVNDASTTNDEWCTAPGNDANDGTSPATPKATVQAILSAYDLEPGDTVHIDTGVYNLSSNITVTSADSGSSGAPVVFAASPYWVVFNRGANSPGCYCWELKASYVTLTTATSTKYPGAGQSWMKTIGGNAGIIGDAAQSCTAERVESYSNTYGVYLKDSSTNFALRNGLLRGNSYGLYLDSATGVVLENCTLALNGSAQVRVGSGCMVTTLRNTILSANSASSRCWDGDAPGTSDYNQWHLTEGATICTSPLVAPTLAGWRAATGGDSHSLAGDPFFVAAGSGDLHLQSKVGSYHGGTWTADPCGSPAIDAGDPGSPCGAEPSPNGGLANLGGYGNTEQASKTRTPQSFYINDGSTASDNWCTAPGSDTNDGLTPATPKATVQAVVSTYALGPGDTVHIDTGYYLLATEIVVSPSDGGNSTTPVTFAASPYGVTLDRAQPGSGSYCWIISGGYVTLTTAAGAHSAVGQSWMRVTGAYTGIYLSWAPSCTLHRVDVSANPSVGLWITRSADVICRNCLIHDNSTGIYATDSTLTLESNTIARNTWSQVEFSYGTSGSTLRNNILWADGSGRRCLNLYSNGYTLTSDYNILCATGGATLSYTSATLSDWRTATGQDAQSLAAYPLFVDAAGGDFHLESPAGSYHGGAWIADAATSPAIDAGCPASPYVAEPAPNGARANLGAYGGTEQASKTPSERLLSLLEPIGGEKYIDRASPVAIRWSCTGTGWQSGDTLSLEYSANSGGTWSPIAGAGAVAANAGTLAWDVSALSPGTHYRVRATCNQDAAVSVSSAGDFCVGTGLAYYVNDASTSNDAWCTAVGSDANDGRSPATPKATVQSVLSAYILGPGDTVYIDTGSYSLSSNITVTSADAGSSLAPLTFAASPYGVTINRGIKSSPYVCWELKSSYILLTTAASTKYPALAQSWMKLTGGWVGVLCDAAADCTAQRVEAYDNSHGVYLRNSSTGFTLRNALVHGNTSSGVYLNSATGVSIESCTVGDNTSEQVHVSTGCAVAALHNTILWANSSSRKCWYGEAAGTSDYNLWYLTSGGVCSATPYAAASLAEWRTATGRDAHSLDGDPLFVLYYSGDWHLQSKSGSYHGGAWTTDADHSPAIDTGDPADSYAGEPAPNGGRMNMGAYGNTEQASKTRLPQSYYVNDGSTTNDNWCTAAGSDANNGLTPSTPKATVQAIVAAYALGPGDTVHIDTGTYNLTSNIVVTTGDGGSSAAPVTFAASPYGVTINRGSTTTGSCSWVVTTDYVTVTTAAGTKYPALPQSWMRVTGGSAGMAAGNARSGVFERVEVCGNSGTGVSLEGLITGFTLRNILAHDNRTGFSLYDAAGLVIENCTVALNDTYQMWVDTGGTPAVLRNNILWADGAGMSCFYWRPSDYPAHADHNIYSYTNGADLTYRAHTLPEWQVLTGQEGQSISADPLLVNVAAGDFHLQSAASSYHGGAWTADGADSPAIDAGDPASAYANEPAPNGGRVNLGAYGNTEQASKSPDLTPHPDLLVKNGGEADTAYAIDNTYQTTPSGNQVEVLAVNPNTPATYQVKVENDGSAARTFVLKAEESAETGWSITYKKADTTDISTAMRSAGGFTTDSLAPGAFQVISVEVIPTRLAPAGTSKTAVVKAFQDGTATECLDAVQATTWVFGLDQADLFIRLGSEPDAAFAIDDEYQWFPSGAQVEALAVNPGQTAAYPVRIQNDGNTTRAYVLKAEETAETGWQITYLDPLGADITAQFLSAGGYTTGSLAPGAAETITVRVKPLVTSTPGTAKTTVVKAYLDGAAPGWYDAVQATTWVFGMELGDLLVKQGPEPDGAYGIDDEYQWFPQGAQVESVAVNPNQTVSYQAKVQNDGNVARAFTVKGEETAETGWQVTYRNGAAQDVTAQILSANGYTTGTLAGGGSEVLTVEVKPLATSTPGTAKTTVLRLFRDKDAPGWYDAVQATTWVFGMELGDLLVKQGTEPEGAYGIDDGHQWIPQGGQVECVAVNPNTTATCQVKVENDGNVARTFTVKGEETAEAGWQVVYRNQAAQDVTAQVLSANGYTTGTLPGGGSEVIAVEMKPTVNAAPGTSKTAVLRLFREAGDTGWYDAVQATTWVFAYERGDLSVKQEGEPDALYGINDEYQWVPAGAQVEALAVNPGQTAAYQVKVENDGNIARTFVLKAQETGEAGWTLAYKQGASDITSLVKGAGYETQALAPGASEVITVEMTPVTAPGGTPTTTYLRVYPTAGAPDSWDVVQITTWEFGL